MTDTDRLETIKVSIEEQRHLYAITSNIYDQLRIKALALIAGEVAIVTFLFTGWDFRKVLEGSDRTFFFLSGVILLGLAFAFLLWIISTVPWKMAHNFSTANVHFNDQNAGNYQRFLEKLHDDYCSVNKYCLNLVSGKCRKFNWSLYVLSAGVITIMVIKFGGPQL